MIRVLVTFSLLFLSGCISVDLSRRERPLEETTVSGEGADKILLLPIEGVLLEGDAPGGLFAPDRQSTTSLVREQLDKARRDDDVRAVVLRINSPGGTVTASDVVHREILRFKREKGVPVVAHLMGVAASGGYYVAMAADEVRSEPTSVTGSIGVIFVNVNVSGLMEKIGVEDQTLVAGRSKDAGSMLRPMRREERAQLQSILDDMHARFREVVAAGRPALAADAVETLSDGRIYSAPQALDAGLVDAVGGLSETVTVAERRAGLARSRVVTYHRPREWKKNVYSKPLVPPRVEVDWWPGLPRFDAPAFLYLWSPGLH